MQNNWLDLGLVAIAFLFFIKEFFTYLKEKGNKGQKNELKDTLSNIELQLNNHMNDYNNKLLKTSIAQDLMKSSIDIIKDDIRDIKNDVRLIRNK